jgi:hypothetical protein
MRQCFSGGVLVIQRIILLTQFPFTRRDYDRFGVEVLMQNGFDVAVWDCTPMVNPHVCAGHAVEPPLCRDTVVFHEKGGFVRALRGLSKQDIIISLVLFDVQSWWIYRVMSASVAEYAFFCANAAPSIGAVKVPGVQKLAKIFKLFEPGAWARLFRKLFPRIPLVFLGVKPARFVLLGGEKSLAYHIPHNVHTEKIWAHTLDYDIYLKERAAPIVEKKTAVFIDEYFPFHPDWAYWGVAPSITAAAYYPALNRFFDLFEKTCGMSVVIAAHPRSKYEDHPDYFNGRPWMRGRTAQLIRDSTVVLVHYSTALCFANVYDKPVIFLTDRELEAGNQRFFINAMAEWFGKKSIRVDCDSPVDWDAEMTIDRVKYRAYRQAYIKTSQSPDTPFWQIVADRLKKGI